MRNLPKGKIRLFRFVLGDSPETLSITNDGIAAKKIKQQTFLFLKKIVACYAV
jgi:hypothetical protein